MCRPSPYLRNHPRRPSQRRPWRRSGYYRRSRLGGPARPSPGIRPKPRRARRSPREDHGDLCLVRASERWPTCSGAQCRSWPWEHHPRSVSSHPWSRASSLFGSTRPEFNQRRTAQDDRLPRRVLKVRPFTVSHGRSSHGLAQVTVQGHGPRRPERASGPPVCQVQVASSAYAARAAGRLAVTAFPAAGRPRRIALATSARLAPACLASRT